RSRGGGAGRRPRGRDVRRALLVLGVPSRAAQGGWFEDRDDEVVDGGRPAGGCGRFDGCRNPRVAQDWGLHVRRSPGVGRGVGRGGGPRVAALGFVWLEDGSYVSVRAGSSTWNDVERDPRVGIVLDRGTDWNELAGVSIEGTAEPFPSEHPDARTAMSAWLEK